MLAAAAMALPTAALGAPGAHAAPTCLNTSAALTVEERRLDDPVPQEILRRSGFDVRWYDFEVCSVERRPLRIQHQAHDRQRRR